MTAVHETKKPYTRRSDDDRIAELQAKIEGIRTRGERKQARANPAVRLTVNAVKLLDKALNATQDGVARKVIEEARQGLGAYVATQGWAVPTAGDIEPPKKRGRKTKAA
jgi:hypothetical protein